MSENIEIKGGNKKKRNLPIHLSGKAKKNLTLLQGLYQAKYGKFINLKNLGTRIFENATPEIL